MEHMSDTNGPQAETTESTERKPPTIAEIVREKTDDGKRIIDFFLDVMEDRVDGAELCHRIDAAKQLEKHKSKAAAEFLAEYKGVPCGHSTRGRRNSADPCSAEERTLVEVTLNAPPTLTREFLTVLSGIDEFLMARLIRAQTADGVTVIEFLDDVMQDRTDGFKTHHRIAAAKELIVHIVRDEQPAPTPSPSTEERREPALSLSKGEGDPPPLPQGEGCGEGDSTVVPAQPEGNPDNPTVVPAKAGTHPPDPALSSVEGPDETPPIVVPAEVGTQGAGGGHNTPANPARTEPNTTVVPAQSLPRTRYGAGTQGAGGGRNTPANPARTEPVLSTVEGPSSTVIPAESLPRTRYGAGTQRGGGDRNTPANPARTEPVPIPAEGPVLSNVEGSVPTKEPAEGPALPSLPQLTTNNQQLKTLPPGRSPPW